jgi:hypothetical protein
MDMQTVTPHRRTAEGHFEVVIRLRQSPNGQPSDATLRLRAQALLKDILMSRLEMEAEVNAHESVHTRGFGDLGRALAASRALQLAFEGFRTAVPAARANVSVVLDSSAPDETGSAQGGISVEQKDLLDLAKPSQVLITQAFYDRIALYQPALRSSTLRAGVYEFLWTNEQRLNELQAEAEFMPTLIQPPPVAEPVAATMIVPAVKSVPVSRWKEPDPKYAPAPEPAYEDQAPAKRLSTPWLLAIGSAVIILCAIGYLVSSFVFGNRTEPLAQVPRQAKPAPARQSPTPPPTAPPNTVVQAEPAVGDAPKVIAPPTIVRPQRPNVASDRGGSSPQPPTPKPAAKTRGCTLDNDEIARFLSLADRYGSEGKYERAISNYNTVLSCQPGNRQAQTGLRNAVDAEKYSHQ